MAARSFGQCSPRHRVRPWPGTTFAQAACLAADTPDRNIVAAGPVRRAEQDKEAALVASLARRFTALVCDCGVRQPTRPAAPLADLDAWLAEARACGVSAVGTFAAGLEQDGAAVRAALTLPWSYGRASLDLLRRRVLMPA